LQETENELFRYFCAVRECIDKFEFEYQKEIDALAAAQKKATPLNSDGQIFNAFPPTISENATYREVTNESPDAGKILNSVLDDLVIEGKLSNDNVGKILSKIPKKTL